MNVSQVLCMNGGMGEKSYANNSLTQKRAMVVAKPILQDTIDELFSNSSSFPECVKLADLGCSSGPNTFLLVWEIMNMIDANYRRLKCEKKLSFLVFLNDLFGNDFNNIFKSLPSFYEKIKDEKGSDLGPCFMAAMPGSFYGRLFPDDSLHFVSCAFCLHWLSEVPEGLKSENKGNICNAKTSPKSVHKAYVDVFEKDFTTFLRSRAQEMIHGGHMFLTIVGKDWNSNSSSNGNTNIFELLGITLHDMVLEGLVEESKLDMFNLPFYTPTPEEVKSVIKTEGSYNVKRFEFINVNWDANDEEVSNFDRNGRGKYVSMSIRAVAEPILTNHFGYEIMDDLFERFANKIEEYMEVNKGVYFSIIISLIKG